MKPAVKKPGKISNISIQVRTTAPEQIFCINLTDCVLRRLYLYFLKTKDTGVKRKKRIFALA
jgi:hypothetical protein